MSMKQKLQDIALLLKKDRKWQIMAVLLVGAILFLMMSDNPRQTRRKAKKNQQVETGVGNLGSKEAYTDLIEAFKETQEMLVRENTERKEEIQTIGKSIERYEERTANIFKRIITRMEDIEATNVIASNAAAPSAISADSTYPDPVDVSTTGEETDGLEYSGSDSLESFGDPSALPPVAPPPEPERSRIAFIGAGDSVRIKLLAGVNAPTNGTPYPVVFKLVDDIHGPDGSALPVGEARLIAAAQGSLADARALFRLTSLNIRLPDNSRKVVKVDGWVVGEDGIRGMEGILIDPIGKAIVGAGFVSGLSAAGQGFSQAQLDRVQNEDGSTSEYLNGNVGIFAGGRALSGAASTWSRIVQDRLRKVVPHVQVYSGREATAVFAKNVEIPGLIEALEEEHSVFSSLD